MIVGAGAIGDAIRIRNHVVRLLERADLLLPEQRRHLLTFAVVGGGLNGIEVAGELHDFVVHAVGDYSNICADDIRMVLIARSLPLRPLRLLITKQG